MKHLINNKKKIADLSSDNFTERSSLMPHERNDLDLLGVLSWSSSD